MKYSPIQVKSVSPQKMQTVTFNQFLGVDFTRGDYITDIRRSPDALNTVWGENPYVFTTRAGIKRLYPTKIKDTAGNPLAIYGIHIFEPDNEILIHAGTKFFRYNGTEEDFKEGTGICTDLGITVAAQCSTSFMMNGVLYILGAGEYLSYDGSSILPVADGTNTYIPTTVIGREPSGGGTPFEAVNLLNKWRKNSFVSKSIPQEFEDKYNGDGTAKAFDLAIKTSVQYDTVSVTVGGVKKYEGVDFDIDRVQGAVIFETAPTTGTNNVKITYTAEDMDNLSWAATYQLDSGDIDDDAVTAIVNGESKEETTDFTVDRTTGIVTFLGAPEATLGGVDNVIITFAKSVDGYAEQIDKCKIYGIFGGENDSRVFLTGNDDFPNTDWHSGLYDPTYFPDTGYTRHGADNTQIMGYVKQYDTQMLIKEGNQQDGSAFLRTFSIDEAGNPVFPVEQGAVGIGAISHRTFAYLQGEPLFLSSQGVIGISGSNVDNQRLMRDKSTLINTKLTFETGLENAIGIEHLNKYYLFINGKVFVADARMRYTDEFGNQQYEWMYWNNLPATAAKVHIAQSGQAYLLIGYDGMVFRFNEERDFRVYIDEDGNGEEHNIDTYWTTPNLYLGSIAVKKRVHELNILFKKDIRINVDIEAVIDNERTVSLGNYASAGVLDFADIDFEDFTFLSYNPTFVFKQRCMLERLDNIRLKISKAETEYIYNSSLGIELMQLNYQLLNN